LTSQIENNLSILSLPIPPYNLSGNGVHWVGNKTGSDWYGYKVALRKIKAEKQEQGKSEEE